MKNGGIYRIGGCVGFGEKSGLSEIAEVEGFLVLENVQIVVLPVLENLGETKQSNIKLVSKPLINKG